MVQSCLRKNGLSVVSGTYLSGKTTAVAGLIHALFSTTQRIKEQEEF